MFQAFDPSLDRDVALKVPHLSVMLDARLRERFFQEGRAAAGLDHPNVVPVFEAGEIGPICYIASAYCSGPTLAEWLRKRTDPLPFDLAARITADLAAAVQHAHERGILHRDLKPSNVLMVETAEGATVPKITDFGLAKVERDRPSLESTRTGAIVGTPAYMAPEQASGKRVEVRPESDVYSLGSILYEILTGRPPFQGESALDVLVQVRSCDPIPPSKLRPKTPRDLETICLQCLEKDPARRYASATDLADDLQRYLERQPIRARPVGRVYSAARWLYRRPLVASLLAALLIVTLVGFAGIYGQWRRANARAREAERQREIALRERERAEDTLRIALDSVHEFFTRASEERLFDRPGSAPIRRELLRSGLHYYQRFLEKNENNPRLQFEIGKARHRYGSILSRLGHAQAARQQLEESQKTLTACLAADPDNREIQRALSETEILLGRVLIRHTDRQQAKTLFERAAQRMKTLCRAVPTDRIAKHILADAQYASALVELDWHHGKEARELCREAEQLLLPLIDEEPKQDQHRILLAQVYLALAHGQQQRGAFGEAVSQYERALAQLPSDTDRVPILGIRATVVLNQGAALLEIGRRSDAIQCFEKATRLLRQLMHDDPDAEINFSRMRYIDVNLGDTYRYVGNAREALRLYRQAMTRVERRLEGHPDSVEYREELAKICIRIGFALQMLRQNEEALEFMQRAFTIWKQLAAAQPNVRAYQRSVANCNSAIGTYYSQRRLFDKTWPYYQASMAIHRKILAADPHDPNAHCDLARVLNDVAVTHILLRQYEAAETPILSAIEHQATALRTSPESTHFREKLSRHYATLARLRRETGRWREALEACESRRRLWKTSGVQILGAAHGTLRIAVDLGRRPPDSLSAEEVELKKLCVDRALEMLAEAIDHGFDEIEFLRTDPVFGTLKEDPRFQRLIQRLEPH